MFPLQWHPPKKSLQPVRWTGTGGQVWRARPTPTGSAAPCSRRTVWAWSSPVTAGWAKPTSDARPRRLRPGRLHPPAPQPGTGSATPYGCLSFTLARLPQSSLGSPTAILHGITSLIRDDAAGRKCVILLDNAGALDELSTGVLLNLLQTRTARLVATAQRTTDLPPDFYWLITSGQLAEVRLANLTEVETLRGAQGSPGAPGVHRAGQPVAPTGWRQPDPAAGRGLRADRTRQPRAVRICVDPGG